MDQLFKAILETRGVSYSASMTNPYLYSKRRFLHSNPEAAAFTICVYDIFLTFGKEASLQPQPQLTSC